MSSPAPTLASSAAALHQSLLQYLTLIQQSGAAAASELGIKDLEPLEVAIQCLTEATGQTAATSSDASLLEIFTLGQSTLSSITSSPKYTQFIQNLREKTDFFKGVPEGSYEYTKRMEQARKKFQAKFGNESASASSSGASSVPAASTPVVTVEAKAKAEAFKNEGNALLSKSPAAAVAKYSEAIALNPQHPIYFANRAAAYVNQKNYEAAIADCEASIKLDAEYPKSRYRLGQCYSALGQHEEALEAFQAALDRSGKDEGMMVTIREQIKLTKQKLNPVEQHAGGDDPFAALGGMGGMGGPGGLDFGALMNNPMIQNLMQSPDMMNMMKNMDFGAMMKQMGGAEGLGLGGAGAGAPAAATPALNTNYQPPSASDLFDDEPMGQASPAAAAPKPAASAASSSTSSSSGAALPPQLQAFLSSPAGQQAMADPDLAPVIEAVKKGGPSAAMQFMGNPKVMQKLTGILGPLMGKK